MFELRIPPPVYLLFIAGVMWWLDRHWPLITVIERPWNKLGAGFIVLGLVIDVWALLLFFRSKTTFSPLRPSLTETIVSNGIYRLCRNPMYLGMLLCLIGLAVLLGSLAPFLLLPLFILLINRQQILPEERILEEKFGEEYLAYKDTSRRWI